jgi:hypothetical protein
MDKFNYILTYWFKIMLKRKDMESNSNISEDDHLHIIEIYEEFEERKRLRKIKFSLLFKNDFIDVKDKQITNCDL